MTGTRTQVAETLRSGMSRILRDSLRTFSSSELQPPSLSEPAQGTTLRASGAGNGESSPSLSWTSHARHRPASRARGCRRRPASRHRGGRCRAGRRPRRPGRRRPRARETPPACRAPSASIIVRVVQLGLPMMPLGRFADRVGVDLGHDQRHVGVHPEGARVVDDDDPARTAIGAHSAETSSGTSNIATSTPSKTSGASAWTTTCSPRTSSSLPAERAEATRRISPQTSSRVERICRMTVPTAPVAPTRARVGLRNGCCHRPVPP